MSPCFATTTHCRLDRLTSQARYVRGHFSRRAMHASGDAPWHSSAKHHILEACFFRVTPFRSMLLTLQRWSAALHSKGSERTCIHSGLPTFLHCTFRSCPPGLRSRCGARARPGCTMSSRRFSARARCVHPRVPASCSTAAYPAAAPPHAPPPAPSLRLSAAGPRGAPDTAAPLSRATPARARRRPARGAPAAPVGRRPDRAGRRGPATVGDGARGARRSGAPPGAVPPAPAPPAPCPRGLPRRTRAAPRGRLARWRRSPQAGGPAGCRTPGAGGPPRGAGAGTMSPLARRAGRGSPRGAGMGPLP